MKIWGWINTVITGLVGGIFFITALETGSVVAWVVTIALASVSSYIFTSMYGEL